MHVYGVCMRLYVFFLQIKACTYTAPPSQNYSSGVLAMQCLRDKTHATAPSTKSGAKVIFPQCPAGHDGGLWGLPVLAINA